MLCISPHEGVRCEDDIGIYAKGGGLSYYRVKEPGAPLPSPNDRRRDSGVPDAFLSRVLVPVQPAYRELNRAIEGRRVPNLLAEQVDLIIPGDLLLRAEQLGNGLPLESIQGGSVKLYMPSRLV